MKLYSWALENLLPRMAEHGVPAGFPLYGSVVAAAEAVLEHAAAGEKAVVLEVDSPELAESFELDADWVDQIAQMAADEAQEEVGGILPEEGVREIYDSVYAQAEEASTIEAAIEFADWVMNVEPIPPDQVVTLSNPVIEGNPADPEEELTVSFPGDRIPLAKFKRPLMKQLLRSIFLRRPN